MTAAPVPLGGRSGLGFRGKDHITLGLASQLDPCSLDSLLGDPSLACLGHDRAPLPGVTDPKLSLPGLNQPRMTPAWPDYSKAQEAHLMTLFAPQNDLERQLIAAQEGQLPAEDFIATLLGSEVFMPIYERHQIGGLQTDRGAALPLKIQTDTGEVLVLFTSPERAKHFVGDYPGYGGGLVVDFTWILEKLGIGFAISLNPGESFGMDFEAQDLERMARMRAH